jgi:Caspase domain
MTNYVFGVAHSDTCQQITFSSEGAMQAIKSMHSASMLLVANALCLLLLPSAAAQPQSPVGQPRRLAHRQEQLKALPNKSDRFALIIGVDKYQDEEITTLEGASNDARALAETLIRCAGFPADQVILLSSNQSLERQPTRANILRRLSNLRQAVPREGMLLVYFSGHGMVRQIGRTQQAYLLPMDAQVEGDIDLAEDSAISVETMRDRIRDTGVEQVIVILDACRNDPLTSRSVRAKARPMSEAFKRFDFSRNQGIKAFAVIYATQVGEVAYENKEKQQGYFTLALVEGLQGKAAENGTVTLLNLIKYVESRVPRLTALQGLKQQPFSVIEGYKADELIMAYAGDLSPATNMAEQARDLLTRKMAFAVGLSIAIMGQSTQRVGVPIFVQSLTELGFAADKVQAFSRRYEALERSMRNSDRAAQTSDAGQLSQADLLAILRDHIRAQSGNPYPPYVDLGYDLGHLMIIFRFWEQWEDHPSRMAITEERLTSLQEQIQRVAIPLALVERVRAIRASRLADKHDREDAKQVLDAILGHFDR